MKGLRSSWQYFWLGVASILDISGNLLGRVLDEDMEEMREEWRRQDEEQRVEWNKGRNKK